MREVLSARSINRPICEKCHASPCDIVAIVMPSSKWLDHFTCLKKLYDESKDRARGLGRQDHQEELVDFFPHRRGDHFTDSAGVFPRGAEAGNDRVRIAVV